MYQRRWGVVCALRDEALALGAERTQIAYTPALLITAGGVGSTMAAAAAAELVAAGATGLISAGCAASLSPSLKPGQLLLPRRVVASNGQCYGVDAPCWEALWQRLAPLQPHSGPLAEVPSVVESAAAKRALATATAATAADMESAAVARVAQQYGLPFGVVRAVSDGADQSVPPVIAALIDPSGQLRWRALLALLGGHPHQWPALWRLARGYRRALSTLRQARQLWDQDIG